MSEIWKSHGIPVYIDWVNKIILELDLNEWETNFIKSIYKRLKTNHDLTEYQAKALEKIYVRTS